MVVNYASSAGAAEDVAQEIKASGGDAIVVGADLSKQEDIERCSSVSHLRHPFCLHYALAVAFKPGWHACCTHVMSGTGLLQERALLSAGQPLSNQTRCCTQAISPE